MAVYYNSRADHEVRWRNYDLQLREIGFWVKWQHDHTTAEYKYAIGLKGERQPMGIYAGEETAEAMAKLLLSNAKEGN